MKNITVSFNSTAAFVKDIERSKTFYTRVLGQVVEFYFETEAIRCQLRAVFCRGAHRDQEEGNLGGVVS